jgi:hypothetical protein
MEFEIEYCLNFRTLFYPATSNEQCKEDENEFALSFFTKYDLRVAADDATSASSEWNLDRSIPRRSQFDLIQFAFSIFARANPTVGEAYHNPEYEALFKRLLLNNPDIASNLLKSYSNDCNLGQSSDDNAAAIAVDFNRKTGVQWLQTLRQYQITRESLPNAQRLAAWAGADLPVRAKKAPRDLETALDAFLRAYLDSAGISQPSNCTGNSNGEVPRIRSIVEDIVQITALARFLDGRRPLEIDRFALSMEDSEGKEALSRKLGTMTMRVRNQLFRIAASALEEIEPRVLYAIDSGMYGRKLDRYFRNPTILGLCIRRLSLYYRRIMMRYRSFGSSKALIQNFCPAGRLIQYLFWLFPHFANLCCLSQS